MEKAYSKRELDLMFKNTQEKNDAWSSTILKTMENHHKERQEAMEDMRVHEIRPILEQATKTNGRVGRLESRADKTDRWRAWLTGAAFILVPVFVSVCSWVVLRQLSLDRSIESAIDARFQDYQVTGTVQITN